VKIVRIITLAIAVPLLFSCLSKKPEIPGTETPAGPLLQVLEHQRQSLTTLKAIARVDAVRGGKKRAFDTVGIVLDGQRRLRLEAFGPLGQSILALVWDGKDVLLRLPDDNRIMRPGQSGIERTLGMNIEARDLCALLSGTIPELSGLSEARAYCTPNSVCVIEVSEGDMVRRFRVVPVLSGQALRILAQELYRADTPMYRVRYDGVEEISNLMIPTKVILESPGKNVTLTIEYSDVEVNVPLPQESFTLTAGGGDAR
jgi:hypothetical protein